MVLVSMTVQPGPAVQPCIKMRAHITNCSFVQIDTGNLHQERRRCKKHSGPVQHIAHGDDQRHDSPLPMRHAAGSRSRPTLADAARTWPGRTRRFACWRGALAPRWGRVVAAPTSLWGRVLCMRRPRIVTNRLCCYPAAGDSACRVRPLAETTLSTTCQTMTKIGWKKSCANKRGEREGNTEQKSDVKRMRAPSRSPAARQQGPTTIDFIQFSEISNLALRHSGSPHGLRALSGPVDSGLVA